MLSPLPALLTTAVLWMPPQQTDAAVERPVANSMGRYAAAPDESENISVYQQNAPAVVNVNSGKNQGAGVIVTPDGLLVTNKHVVLGTPVVTVKTADENAYKAQLVAMGSSNQDLAFYRIQANQAFPFVRMGDSSGVRVGQRVLAIGSPFGLDGTLTTGIVSRIDRRRNMIQTDAAINPGNSGGALLDTRGNLIGINRSIINPVGASSAGISFAVPVNVVKQELANLGIRSTAVAQSSLAGQGHF